MGKFSDKITKNKSAPSVELDALPRTDQITVTGRRLSIGRMHAAHTRRIVQSTRGVEGKDNDRVISEDWELIPWLIQELVQEIKPDKSIKFIKYSSLTIGEETDIILLMRLVSLGRMLPLTYRCLRCDHINEDRILDVGLMKRYIQVPKDPKHIAHVLAHYNPIKDIGNDELTADFSELPEGYPEYLKNNHMDYLVTTPDRGHKIEYHLPLARDKQHIGEWAATEDPEIVEKSMSRFIVSIDGERFVDDELYIIPEKEKKLVETIKSFSSRDLFTVRDHIEVEDIGVDTDIDIACNGKGCRCVTRYPISMGAPFFLPKKVDTTISTKRSQRYRSRD